jgi:hypothetical protein
MHEYVTNCSARKKATWAVTWSVSVLCMQREHEVVDKAKPSWKIMQPFCITILKDSHGSSRMNRRPRVPYRGASQKKAKSPKSGNQGKRKKEKNCKKPERNSKNNGTGTVVVSLVTLVTRVTVGAPRTPTGWQMSTGTE